jgi:poly-gamma-glutamate synthesis protein (capsule biosynthesis protein)
MENMNVFRKRKIENKQQFPHIILTLCIVVTGAGIITLGVWLLKGKSREVSLINDFLSPIIGKDYDNNPKPSISPLIFPPPEVTLESIFSTHTTSSANIDPARKINIIVTGDVIPARSVNHRTVTSKNFLWPYEKTADILLSGDLTIANLETPLLSVCPLTVEGMVFCGDARNTEGLVFAGIDAVNLANNHSGNYGVSGITETVKTLEKAGMTTFGNSDIVYKDVKNIRIALLGYNDLFPPGVDRGLLESRIKEARTQVQLVIVAFHWGVEYTGQPTEGQKELAHLSIDSGADLVIGNHPHWIQPAELYKDKLIVYAHGNFVFDQMWSEKTKEGVVGSYTFYDGKLVEAQFLPIYIKDYGQPEFLEGERKQKILGEMYQNSLELKNSY